MFYMPSQTGNRMPDAMRSLREKISKRTGERQQVNSLHRQRMTCSASVSPFTNTQDWTNGMGMSPSGRFRIVTEAQPRRKVFSREGIRWDAAWAMLGVTIFLCAAILLADVAGIGLGARSISRLDRKIEDKVKYNEELKQSLAVKAGDATVCTEAVKLNMISGYGAPTVCLTVPQEMSAGAVTREIRSASAGWTTGGVED